MYYYSAKWCHMVYIMRVLGIETSCDETGVAIYDSERGLLADVLHSQINTHSQYGGVVPELASRDHVQYLVPLVQQALTQANLSKADLNAVAYTAGPGLVGALLTGASFAKSMAFSLNIPAIRVHHLEAHMLAAQLDNPNLKFPFMVLLVSGGHTQIIQAHKLGDYELLGDTLDDAVGEAFDKTAKLMGIPYPGGAKLASLADNYQPSTDVLPSFPRPMTDRPGLDLSFSGLKTHALNTWNKSDKTEKAKQVIAFAFQEAVVETLVIKCRRAVKLTQGTNLVVAGGVGANRALRQALQSLMASLGGEAHFPSLALCTDNGAMVAYAGCLHFLKGQKDLSDEILVRPRWPLS